MKETIKSILIEARDALILEQGDIAGQIAALNYLIDGAKSALEAASGKKTAGSATSKAKRALVADPMDCAAILRHVELGDATHAEIVAATGLGPRVVLRCLRAMWADGRVGKDAEFWCRTVPINKPSANGAQAEAGE